MKKILIVSFLLVILFIVGCVQPEKVITKYVEKKDCKDCPTCYETLCPECIQVECNTTIEILTLRQTAICEMESKAPVECKVYRQTQEGLELVGTQICKETEYAYTYATNGNCVCKERVCLR